jgi:hypothetical protein
VTAGTLTTNKNWKISTDGVPHQVPVQEFEKRRLIGSRKGKRVSYNEDLQSCWLTSEMATKCWFVQIMPPSMYICHFSSFLLLPPPFPLYYYPHPFILLSPTSFPLYYYPQPFISLLPPPFHFIIAHHPFLSITSTLPSLLLPTSFPSIITTLYYYHPAFPLYYYPPPPFLSVITPNFSFLLLTPSFLSIINLISPSLPVHNYPSLLLSQPYLLLSIIAPLWRAENPGVVYERICHLCIVINPPIVICNKISLLLSLLVFTLFIRV